MVRLGKEQDLQAAVLELLQVGNAQGTAQGTAQGLQGWRGTALELLVQVDIVQASHDQGGTLQVLMGELGTALALQDQTGTGTALELLGLRIPRWSQSELRAGWELRELNQAILG